MSFFNDFIADENNFNRKLETEEFSGLRVFPNAKFSTIGFLGIGAVRPSESNCQKYECMTSTVLMYNATTDEYVASVEVSPNGIKFLQSIWDQCHSKEYRCEIPTHFGATYNCIGWSLGISKWLNPGEVTAYIKSGYNPSEAIKKFIEVKSSVYPNSHISNFDKIVDKFDINHNFVKIPSNNTVAFYFKDGKCTHGSRFLDKLGDKNLGAWTSKLGSSLLISHDLDDLIGSNSLYGNELHYVSVAGSTCENITEPEL